MNGLVKTILKRDKKNVRKIYSQNIEEAFSFNVNLYDNNNIFNTKKINILL